jgi:hypothetical protein
MRMETLGQAEGIGVRYAPDISSVRGYRAMRRVVQPYHLRNLTIMIRTLD